MFVVTVNNPSNVTERMKHSTHENEDLAKVVCQTINIVNPWASASFEEVK